MNLELRNVSKAFGELSVLKNFSFSFPKGITAIIAPSGSGKTTLLRIIAGLEKPDSGEVVFPREGKLSFMFQEDRLLPALTAAENIAVVAGGDKAIGAKWIKLVGLEGFENAYPHELSGGMKRRVALGRTLAFGGEIALLDEPFKGLDSESKEKIQSATLDELREKITIIITHDKAEAERLGAKIFEAEGPPLEIK